MKEKPKRKFLDVETFIEELKADVEIGAEIVHHEVIAAQEAEYGDWGDLPPALLQALKDFGAERPYAHQEQALDLLSAGRDVAAITPTASGKSLIYAVPVLKRMLSEPKARSLFVYPLKALEQDQLRMLQDLAGACGLPPSCCAIMDGDTPQAARKKLKADPPSIMLTTPDMLHYGILPFHSQWEELFKNLHFVVLDELHTYRGVFGSHVAQLLRRLARMAEYYGSSPQWITCSATIANPSEFAESLVGRPFAVIDKNSAPRAARHFIFINPEQKTTTRAANILTRAMDSTLRTIVFTKARKITELVSQWVCESRQDLASKVSSYRSGYLPEERREIEQSLSSGKLLGVVSTSALEMGIDIGGLDVCVLIGYPGTIASTWQRGGRVGRGDSSSLVVMLAGADALDQYFMKHPEDFFARGAEAAVVDPDNEPILEAHLPCAAAELPLLNDDKYMRPKDRLELIADLEEDGLLLRAHSEEPQWYANRRNPHRFVDLRDVGEGFTIMLDSAPFDVESGKRVPKKARTIGSISFGRALKECHQGAMYLHRGQQFVVKRLDLEKHNIFVAGSRARYYTQVKSEKETTILERTRSRPLGNVLLRLGEVEVEETVVGFEKRRIRSGEKMSLHPLDLPPQYFETEGLWFEIDNHILNFLKKNGHTKMGSMHALEHAAIALFPLFVYCDRFDIGGICYPAHPQLGKGGIFIYDGYPGGVGLAAKCFDVMEELLEAVVHLLEECTCENGCPSCIHSPKCGAGNKPLDKAGCLLLTKVMLGHVDPQVDVVEESLEATFEEESPFIDEEESEHRVLVFDLETQRSAEDVGGWRNCHLMRLAVGCVWDSKTGKMTDYYEREADKLIEDLAAADLVVGFNVKRFDYRVLSGYSARNLGSVATFDMLEAVNDVIGYRLSLGHLGQTTLQRPKTADGLQSLAWWKEGKHDLVTQYCRADVELTRDLFFHGIKEGYLLYERKQAGVVRLPVKWDLDKIVEEAQKKRMKQATPTRMRRKRRR